MSADYLKAMGIINAEIELRVKSNMVQAVLDLCDKNPELRKAVIKELGCCRHQDPAECADCAAECPEAPANLEVRE